MSYNQQYQENPHLFGQVYPEFESFVVEHCKGGKALDLGCGQGRDAIMLAQHGFSVTALDNSSIAIEQLQKESQRLNLVIKTFVADLFAFEIREKYDAIVLDSILHFSKIASLVTANSWIKFCYVLQQTDIFLYLFMRRRKKWIASKFGKRH